MADWEDLKKELPDVYTQAAAADLLLEAIDFPRSRRPMFQQSRTFWSRVYREIDNGLVADGYAKLQAAAANDYPHNRVFNPDAQAPTEDAPRVVQRRPAVRGDGYDVFLCYNSRDKPTVEDLARRLHDDGFRVFYDPWELIPGRPVQEQLERALESSRTYAVLLGPRGFGPWQNEEMRVAVSQRVDADADDPDQPRQVISVLLPGASKKDLPPFLRRLGFVDGHAGLDDSAFQKLASAIRGEASGPPGGAAAPDVPRARRPNPFHANFAVDDGTRFVGRHNELRRLRDLLTNGCVSVLGEPKIGKSSLVLEFARSWDGDVLGPIDFHGVEDRDDFYHLLAEELALDNADWRGSIRSALKKRRALLLLDELDAAPPDKLRHEDLGRLRAVCQQNRELKLVAVSRTPVHEVVPDVGRGSPVYNFLVPFELGPMMDDDVRRLLAPWGAAEPVFEASVVEEIVGIVKGHPCQAQLAAHHCYESCFEASHEWRMAWPRDWERLR